MELIKEKIKSEDWVTCKSAVNRLAAINSKGQMGTLVFALEHLDSNKNLYDIANLNLNAGSNLEVKQFNDNYFK